MVYKRCGRMRSLLRRILETLPAEKKGNANYAEDVFFKKVDIKVFGGFLCWVMINV
jgi:hypothetical protein